MQTFFLCCAVTNNGRFDIGRGLQDRAKLLYLPAGHEAVVRLLLGKIADVNAQSDRYGMALRAASLNGHEDVVRLLPDKNADINARSGSYGTALQAASCRDRFASVCNPPSRRPPEPYGFCGTAPTFRVRPLLLAARPT